VRAVPAGLYAKAALEKLGVWSSVELKLTMSENVRAALVRVSRGHRLGSFMKLMQKSIQL
jgi:molybdate transport system substrate-binding protein